MNPIASLVERVRHSWPFDFSREFSIDVTLPAEAVIDRLSRETTELSSYNQRYWDTLKGSRKWIEKPYGSSIGISSFTLQDNFLAKGFPKLIVEGCLLPIQDGTRIVIHSTIEHRGIRLWLISVGGMWLVFLLSSISRILAGQALQSVAPFVCIPTGMLVAGMVFHRGGRERFLEDAARAEQWLRELFAEHLPATISDVPTSAIR